MSSRIGYLPLVVLTLASCAQSEQSDFRPERSSTGKLDVEVFGCEFSTSPEEEVLYLGGYGGSSFTTYQYRLLGDGRLRREIVSKTKRRRPLRVDEVFLSQYDLDLIVEVIVRGRLDGMTSKTLRKAWGQTLTLPIDGSSMYLRVQLANCDSTEGGIGPRFTEVMMPAPYYHARKLPGVREFEAFPTLFEALDSFFLETCIDVLHNPGKMASKIDLSQRSFTISADPSVEVLWFESRGGMSGETFNYVLYGDGRLVRTYTWAPGESDTRAIQIGFPDARDLVSLAVEGDLMEWDWGRIENQIVQSRGRVPSWTDSRVYELRIALESYSGSPEGPGRSMNKTIVASSIGFLRYELPSVREIAAFDDLAKTLSLYFQPQEEQD